MVRSHRISRGTGRLASVAAIAGLMSVGVVATASNIASAALVNIDGTQPLDLVEDSRLFAVEHYSDKLYELTAGPKNTTVAADRSILVEHNRGATYDPDEGLVYFITGGFSGCALNQFDPETSAKSLVVTLSTGTTPLTSCWGLTTLGGGAAVIAAGSTLYDINLTTGALSSPRELPCQGSSIAYDPSTGILYSGKNNGELYLVDITDTDATCTLVTTLVDVVDGGTENLKGFTFDTDGTLYLLSRWAPQLFSLTPGELTEPINYYGDIRLTPADSQLPMDSLVVVYTPLPDPTEGGPSVAELSNTGFDPASYSLFGVVLIAGAVAIAVGLLGASVALRRRTSSMLE